jgi:hypothetical protein
MQADGALADAGIEVFEAAAADFDGEAEFHVVPADGDASDARRGMSSLLERPEPDYAGVPVSARVLRLDTLMARRSALAALRCG